MLLPLGSRGTRRRTRSASVATILGPMRLKSRPGQWTQKWETSGGRAGGAEGHLDRQAGARGALGGGRRCSTTCRGGSSLRRRRAREVKVEPRRKQWRKPCPDVRERRGSGGGAVRRSEGMAAGGEIWERNLGLGT
ncbi:dihydroxy-acid dehydratase [Striga asiatica]|uniref:Dihydroxy-acid dehydratase n=1 Tax=Striga asiatica TaxID=4170 RepID=A0A5A7P2K3_STRAF|nr:dihydroxy-acid dehydratase [Striga asiatica]